MSRPNSRTLVHILLISAAEEMSLPNSRYPVHGGIGAISDVVGMLVPCSRTLADSGINVTSRVQQISLTKIRKTDSKLYNHYVLCS
jgi:hypothetical protein